jgi:hypothetical protein
MRSNFGPLDRAARQRAPMGEAKDSAQGAVPLQARKSSISLDPDLGGLLDVRA